jgi:hypothetical protein
LTFRFEPELYRIIRSGEDNVIVPRSLYLKKAVFRLSPNTEMELNIKRLATFGPHVRHILLQCRSSKEIRQVLDHCPNVQSLSLWGDHGNCRDTLLPALEDLSNRRTLKLLSFDPSEFFEMPRNSDLPIPFAQPAFSSLTHLYIINSTPNWKKWAQIADMPRLTHLLMDGVGTFEPGFILQVLKECKLLELLILFKNQDQDDDDDSAILDDDSKIPTSGELESWKGDHRVVVLNRVEDNLRIWEIGARGGQDHWVIAEMVKDVKVKYIEKFRTYISL